MKVSPYKIIFEPRPNRKSKRSGDKSKAQSIELGRSKSTPSSKQQIWTIVLLIEIELKEKIKQSKSFQISIGEPKTKKVRKVKQLPLKLIKIKYNGIQGSVINSIENQLHLTDDFNHESFHKKIMSNLSTEVAQSKSIVLRIWTF